MSTAPVSAAPPRARGLKIAALLIVVFGVTADLWTKSYMQDLLDLRPREHSKNAPVDVIPGFVRWDGTWNPGITFGLAAGMTQPILVFTAIASLGILSWLMLTRSRRVLLHVALGMILAGALGNLYDRWKWQEVRDFIDVYWNDHHWPAFNVADSMIVVGVICIVAIELFGHRDESVPAAGASTPA